ALSPLAPVGIARQAELHAGVALDVGVVVGGAALVAAFLIGLTCLATWLADRRRDAAGPRRNGLPSRMATAGLPAPLVAGADMALSARRRGIPGARPAIAALVVGVLTVVGASVVHASLLSLLDTPSRRGWAWDAQVGDITTQQDAAAGAQALEGDPDVAGYAGVYGGGGLPIDGPPTPITPLDPHGDVARPIVPQGRPPHRPGGVGAGPR